MVQLLDCSGEMLVAGVRCNVCTQCGNSLKGFQVEIDVRQINFCVLIFGEYYLIGTLMIDSLALILES